MVNANEPAGRRPCRMHPHLFQVNTWAWLDALERKAGRMLKLIDVADAEWDALRAQGFDLIYLMGLWRRSPAGRHVFRTAAHAFAGFDHALPGWTLANVIGSPFSILEDAPDPRIGTWDDVDAVRMRLAARGMRLILDFVPNHVGLDHAWVRQRPEFLMQGGREDFEREPAAFILAEPADGPACFVARGRDPYFLPWADVAQIDHFNPLARAALLARLRNIAEHCDGLRCDMAMLVLNGVFARTWAHLLGNRVAPAREFWSDAIEALPAAFIWIAEAYWDTEPLLQGLGFGYTYDKRLYDCLVGGEAEWTRALLGHDIRAQSRMARFIENHDEKRAMESVGRARLPGLTALIATLPGLRFFHDGQFDGKAIHLPMPLDRAADEPDDTALGAQCRHILEIADDAVFHDGDWSLAAVATAGDATADNLVAYTWQRDRALRLVVLNMRAVTSYAWIRIAGALEPTATYHFTDLLDGQVYVRNGGELVKQGLFVRLQQFGAHVFAIAAQTA